MGRVRGGIVRQRLSVVIWGASVPWHCMPLHSIRGSPWKDAVCYDHIQPSLSVCGRTACPALVAVSGDREPVGVLIEAAGVGLSGPRTYRIYQSITAVLLVIVFIMAGYFVGLVGVNINGAAPSLLPGMGLHWGCVRDGVEGRCQTVELLYLMHSCGITLSKASRNQWRSVCAPVPSQLAERT